MAEVAGGEARVALFSGPDAVRVVYPLSMYDGAQLYGVRLLQPGMMTRLSSVSRAVVDLREAAENSNRVQGVFALAYIETVLLVLVGAVWVGVSAADSIAVPVARLVQAADKVAGGNLDARVVTSHQSEDIAVLSRAFNRMTSDLQSQQAALKSAGEEAEARRRFIETVLSEISAGIVGIDVLEHISAINRHAANFLSVVGEDAIGFNIRELVPEISDLLDKVSVSKVEEQEVDLIRKGETRRLRVRISGLETGGAVITFDDITRLVAAQRNAAWKDVAQRIAHEIKNPLTPIQLSAERIKRKYRDHIDGDIEVFDRLTDTIIRQVGDIGRMVDEFSAFARMPVPNFA
ncbi:MAG: PAS domain-containing sensor histidine kinase, partial [Asticcacaulis sp. 32-58-5]